jgi:hypothetical protein
MPWRNTVIHALSAAEMQDIRIKCGDYWAADLAGRTGEYCERVRSSSGHSINDHSNQRSLKLTIAQINDRSNQREALYRPVDV